MKPLVVIVFCALLAMTGSVLAAAPTPTVGVEGQLSVLLPGPELKARSAERRAPLTLRVASVRPHGRQMQYDLRYIGLVPGRYDLRSFLLQTDGSAAGELPEMTVEVAGVLPPGHPGQLNPRVDQPLPALGGYGGFIGAAVGLWALFAIPLFFRRRSGLEKTTAALATPPTLAERLRPLVELATAGRLTVEQQGQLERLLLTHWRERLDLGALGLAEATARLRAHPEAGALLRALEDWLHRPPGAARVDLDAVLAPYAKIPPAPAGSLP